jgi:hypothetical protein
MACLHNKLENFSWAVLSTAQEKYYFLCDLCGSSEAGGKYSLSCLHRIDRTTSLATGLRYNAIIVHRQAQDQRPQSDS